jgi:thioredoxin-dependent peroxiredoxin
VSGSPRVGEAAPLFEADGTGGRRYSLDEFRGSVVVLVFYPGDATAVCTQQLNSYNADFAQFTDLDAVVLALSPQDIESHESFSAAQGGFAFPLLYDEEKKIGEQYGVVGPLGFYRRSAFVIDGGGVVRYVKRSMAGVGYPSAGELVEAVRAAAG